MNYIFYWLDTDSNVQHSFVQEVLINEDDSPIDTSFMYKVCLHFIPSGGIPLKAEALNTSKTPTFQFDQKEYNKSIEKNHWNYEALYCAKGQLKPISKNFTIIKNKDQVPDFNKEVVPVLNSINIPKGYFNFSTRLLSVSNPKAESLKAEPLKTEPSELVWALVESCSESFVFTQDWIPAYKYKSGKLMSVIGELIDPDSESDIRKFTDCPFKGYTISKKQ